MQEFLFPTHILPYLAQPNAFGSIGDTRTLKNIALVCTRWNAWIYNTQRGPFSILGEHLTTLRETHSVNVISHLNSKLRELAQTIIEVFKEGKSLDTLPKYFFPYTIIRDAHNFSPLYYAIQAALVDIKQLYMVSECFKRGSDPNELVAQALKYEVEKAPLFLSVWELPVKKHVDVVANYLINQGADIFLRFGKNQQSLADLVIRHRDVFDFPSFYQFMIKYSSAYSLRRNFLFEFVNQIKYRESFECAKIMCPLLEEDVTSKNKKGRFLIEVLSSRLYGAEEGHETRKLFLKEILRAFPLNEYLGAERQKKLLAKLIRNESLWGLKEISLHLPRKAYINGDCLTHLASCIHAKARQQLIIIGHMRGIGGNIEGRLELKISAYLRLWLDFWQSHLTKQALQKMLTSVNDQGTTFLHLIAKACPGLTEKMVENGYIHLNDVYILDQQGKSVRELANQCEERFICTKAILSGNFPKVLDMLKNKVKPLSRAGDYNLLNHIIFNVAKSKEIDNPNHADFYKNSLVIFKKLVHVINPNKKNKLCGEPVLHNALNYPDFLVALLDAGADPAATDKKGDSLYDKAKNYYEWTMTSQLMPLLR